MAKNKEKKQSTLAQAAENFHRNAADVFGWASVDPSRIGRAFRDHERGEYGLSMPLFEKACRCDFTLKTVEPKRRRAVSKLDWEIQTTDSSHEAKEQAFFLRKFYDSLVVTNTERRDEQARLSTLIFRTMSAINFGYSVAELQWHPCFVDGRASYRVVAETVSLRCFEATERELRIVTGNNTRDGDALFPDSWLIAVSPDDPLIYPTMLLFMLRMTPLQDWAETIEKYGRPIVYGETTANYGSPEWFSFLDALRQLAAGAVCTVNPGAQIKVLPIAQNGTMPHQQILDFLNRALISLWRGGDLSTMSQGSDSAGSNPQSNELDDIAMGDIAFIQDTFEARLTQPFLRRVFGSSVETKAYFAFKNENPERARISRENVEKIHGLGLPISKAHVYEVFGVPAPEAGDDVLQGVSADAALTAPQTFENAYAGDDLGIPPKTEAELALAEKRTFDPILKEVQGALDGDEKTLASALKRILKKFKKLSGAVVENDTEAAAVVKTIGGVR